MLIIPNSLELWLNCSLSWCSDVNSDIAITSGSLPVRKNRLQFNYGRSVTRLHQYEESNQIVRRWKTVRYGVVEKAGVFKKKTSSSLALCLSDWALGLEDSPWVTAWPPPYLSISIAYMLLPRSVCLSHWAIIPFSLCTTLQHISLKCKSDNVTSLLKIFQWLFMTQRKSGAVIAKQTYEGLGDSASCVSCPPSSLPFLYGPVSSAWLTCRSVNIVLNPQGASLPSPTSQSPA